MPSRVVIRAGGSHPTRSTHRVHACTNQRRALASAAQAETAYRMYQTSMKHAEANGMHKQAQTMHTIACIRQQACQTQAQHKHEASRSQACARQAQNMHTVACTRQRRNNQTHAQNKYEACRTPAHFKSKHRRQERTFPAFPEASTHPKTRS